MSRAFGIGPAGETSYDVPRGIGLRPGNEAIGIIR